MGRNRKVRTKSIREKLIYVMLVVIIAQGIVFVAAIFAAGVFDNIKENSLTTLSGYLDSRKSILEREMVLKWSSIEFAAVEVNNVIDRMEAQHNIGFEELTKNKSMLYDVMADSIDSGLSVLKKNDVTGVFIVLNASVLNEDDVEDDKISRAGIYLRDMEPAVISVNNSDILVERGPLKLFESYRLAADSGWAFEFEFDEKGNVHRNAYFDVPFEAAKANPSAAAVELGYWSEPFTMSDSDIDVITYSMPLVGDNKEVRGVIGVEVSLEHLKKILPYSELSESGNGAYVLSIYRAGDTEAEGMVNGPYLKNSFDDMRTVYECVEDGKESLHTLSGKSGSSFVGYGTNVNIYARESSFYDDKWTLFAFLPENEIFALMKDSLRAIMLSSAASLVVSLVVAFISSSHFVKPVSVLAEKVRRINPEKQVNLDRLDIKEIDELSNAIEVMSNGVAEASSRISKIIGMADMPVGAFEVDFTTGYVFLTDSLADMLDIEMNEDAENHVTRENWEEMMATMTKNKVKEYENIYYLDFMDNDEKHKWVRIKTMKESNKELGVVIDVSQEVLEMKRLEFERDMDPLTKLFNRRAFYAEAQQVLDSTREKLAALIFWDIDNLKYVNDTYGHDMGDRYIQRAAEILSAFNEAGGIAARLSGDEFVVLVYGRDTKGEIRGIINAVKKSMEQSLMHFHDGNAMKVRASAGVAWYPDDSRYVDDLIKYADFAMYEIKHSIKGSIKEFDKYSYGRNSFLMQKKELLNEFIEKGDFKFAFQPVVSTTDGSVIGYEALMRPSIEEFSSPGEVLMLSRSQSKLYQIEMLTFRKAFEFMEQNPGVVEEYKIFINSIPNQLLSLDDAERMRAMYGHLYKSLVVEITEEERGSDTYVKSLANNMRSMGSQIAIDDYGAGYSNELSILTIVPDYVKIDMSIIRGIDKDLDRQQIVTSMVKYASERGIKVIAEGVETKEEMKAVICMGVDYIQGYYTGMPAFDIKDVEKSIKDEIIGIAKKKL